MTITTQFKPTDTVWFIDRFTNVAVSSVVYRTDIKIAPDITYTIKHFVSTNSVEYTVDDDLCFASLAALNTYYATP